MYQVFFIPRGIFPRSVEDQAGKLALFKSDSDLQAVQFAMSLHQACNIPHCIRVEDPNGDVISTFFVPEVSNG